MSADNSRFITFTKDISNISLPGKFTFPFYYEPHPLAVLAMQQLQEYLIAHTELDHNFGLIENQEGLVIGKMFGVLVVKDRLEGIGFLAAFSGKLANSNDHEYFVPAVFDLLETDSFFRKEEVVINEVTIRITELEKNEDYIKAQNNLLEAKKIYEVKLQDLKLEIKKSKQERDLLRTSADNEMQPDEREALLEQLRKQSIREQYFLKDFNASNKLKILELEKAVNEFENEIDALKEKRKNMSNSLQQDIFDSYYFLNFKKEKRSLQSIFKDTADHKPPAGAGECAAPKLLQYAFEHDLTPVCLGEFWWGASPKSEVRIHKQFYPACRGKCEPILSHMLEGIETDENPMLINPAENKDLEIIFEDEYLVVVNKPAEFLSVPGINISDSVYTRMKLKYPNATGPLMVHRLDMSTSGILVIAKNKNVHEHLQKQFLKRKVYKRYVALLDGVIEYNKGTIELPLRVDLDDRPRQLVCYGHGKKAVTKWEVIERKDGKTWVYFYPLTGRTHQLRVHAAHSLGLKSPIVGDDIYGKRHSRLHLHAQYLQFNHPVTNEIIKIKSDPDF